MISGILRNILFAFLAFTAPAQESGGGMLYYAQGTLTLPSVPDSLKTPEERANFLAGHYWDNFDFQFIPSEEFEQYWADYCYILKVASFENAMESLCSVLSRVKRKSLMRLFDLSEKYLYGANSPAYNEGLFLYLTEQLMSNRSLSSKQKNQISSIRKNALKNAPGSFAENFFFSCADGKYSSLDSLSAKYIVLLFHYPDCGRCRTTIRIMARNATFNRMLADGDLKILCIYPEADRELWKKESGRIPASWINAYDENSYILENELYYFKTFPALYLLGEDKRVLLKDTDYLEIEDYLNGIR